MPGTVAPVGWTTPYSPPASAPSAATPGSATSPSVQTGSYGYQGDYSWLKGQLEYSSTKRQWKLRYIPRDALEHRIDDFGGSVIIANADALQGYSHGEYVRVEGAVAGRKPGVVDFAPTYQVARIQRQSN